MGDDSGDGDVGRFEARLQYLADVEDSGAAEELKELYGETVGRFLREVCREAGFDSADSDVWSSPSLLVARIDAMRNARYGFRSLAQILGMSPGTEGIAHIVSRVESEHEALVAMRETMQSEIVAGLNIMPAPGPVEVSAPVPVAMILVRLANQVSPVAPEMARPGEMHLQPSSGALWDERVRMSGWLLRLATAVLDARDGADVQVRITAALADLAEVGSGGEGDG